jgi:hypothetical protein
MREEEKLVRDVYRVLYDCWNQNIFNNISGSDNINAAKKILKDIGLGDYMKHYPNELSGGQK